MSRTWRWTLLVSVAVLATAALWTGWSVVRMKAQSERLDEALRHASVSARAFDTDSLEVDLRQVRDAANDLASSSQSLPMRVAAALPWVGEDVAAIQSTADAVDLVAAASAGLDASIPGLAPSRLRGPTGRIDVAKLRSVAPELMRVAAAMTAARAEVDDIDTSNVAGPIADAVTKVQQVLQSAPETLRVMALLPTLLGAEAPRTYAVLLLNPAELRGGGGFFGGYAIVKADHGDITLEKVGPNDDLVKAGPLDVSSLPQEYRELWGQSALEWQSVNISPNFPYAGQLTQQGFAKLGIHVDGVIALDSKVAAALLAGTGPASANGVTVTSKNADAYFTKGIYAQFPDGAGHKPQALALFAQLFEKLTTGPLDMKAMISALAPLLDQRRLLFWTSDSQVEAPFAALPVGGVVPDATGPWTTVALINGAGNKMDAYVKSRVSYLSNRCGTSTAPSTVTLQLANPAPANLPPYVDQRLDDPAAPKGSTLSLAYVYGPVGSALVSADLDGKPVPLQAGVERGHPVWRFSVPLLRGQSRVLTVKIAEPHDRSTAAPVVLAQPMEIDESTAATSVSCG
jgi:hypothetical protein